MSYLIKFTEKNVKEHIDKCIKQWRIKRNEATKLDKKSTAGYYIDAYQSIRLSLFGNLRD